MEEDKLIHAISWSVGYLIVYGLLTVIGNFLFSDEFLIIYGLTGGIYILINAFFLLWKRSIGNKTDGLEKSGHGNNVKVNSCLQEGKLK